MNCIEQLSITWMGQCTRQVGTGYGWG